MSETEKAWLACAIDGEGYISKIKDSRAKYFPATKVRVAISNTDIAFIKNAERIAVKILNEPVIIQTQRPTKTTLGKKDCFILAINGKKSQLLLQQILPFLIIKKKKAEEILALKLRTHKEQLESLHTLEVWHLPNRLASLREHALARQRDSLGRFTPIEVI